MLVIIIGTASVIAMLSIGAGAQKRVAEQIRTLGANVAMAYPDREAPKYVRPRPLTLGDVHAIDTSVPGVIAAAPALQGNGPLVNGNRNRRSRINGTTAAYFPIRDWRIETGRNFSDREISGAGKVAILGATVATQLFGTDDPVGQEIRVLNSPMRIIGVLARKGASGTGTDQDDIVFVPFSTAELHLGSEIKGITPGKVSYILAKIAPDRSLDQAVSEIDLLLRQRRGLTSDDLTDFRVTNPAAALAAERGSTRTVGWLLAAIASISLVVGGIGIMNIMLVSINDATREIGVRLALGARPRDISWLFLTEAFILCGIGSLFGVFVGIIVSQVVGHLAGWPVLISPETLIAALGFSCTVGMVFAYYPSRMAAKMHPAQALKR
jgi:putative ABC transport system permease protein